jgi:cellobiose phosphorylase
LLGFGETRYEIRVENPQGINRGVKQVLLDGDSLPDGRIPLRPDGGEHKVIVTLGE